MQRQSGDERATLVLLPGLDGTDVFFGPLIAALPPWIRPVVVRYPQSGPTGYGDLLEVVRDSVTDLGEVYLLGASFAGPLALMYAAAEPERVRGLILCASFLRSPYRCPTWFPGTLTVPVVWAVRAIRRIPVWLRRRDDPLRAAKARTWSQASTRGIAARVRAIAAVDARDLARRSAQPILCVHFDGDRVVGRKHADDIRRHATAFTGVTLRGNHLGVFTAPRALAEVVSDFMQSHGVRRRRAAPRGDVTGTSRPVR